MRTVIDRQDLYKLLEERFRAHRARTGCLVCKTPFPFFCDSPEGANWRVAVLPACERSCRKTLLAIVDEMAAKYELSPPLWRKAYPRPADTQAAAPPRHLHAVGE